MMMQTNGNLHDSCAQRVKPGLRLLIEVSTDADGVPRVDRILATASTKELHELGQQIKRQVESAIASLDVEGRAREGVLNELRSHWCHMTAREIAKACSAFDALPKLKRDALLAELVRQHEIRTIAGERTTRYQALSEASRSARRQAERA